MTGKYRAVVFDLFGTLIFNMTKADHERTLRRMADILGAPSDEFVRQWYATFDDRITGVLPSAEANIDYVCGRLGVPVSPAPRAKAAQIRLELNINTMKPVPGAVDTVSRVRALGHRTALVSDCSSEVPRVWPNTPFATLFDAAIFSCVVGIKKPDPRIYRMATSQLGVEPADCIYVGDGSSHELTGAAAVGMRPVLVRDPSEDAAAMHRVEAEGESWRGPVISSLPEVLTLL